jgi:hypothetical protein
MCYVDNASDFDVRPDALRRRAFSFGGGRETIGGDAALSQWLLIRDGTRGLYFSGH